jgi:hypothetical protein
MAATSRTRLRGAAGQGLVEFLIIFWFAFSLLMLVIQISLMFNAHSMLKLAAYNAARAAIVARSDKGSEKPVTTKRMLEKARLAAFLTILPVIPGMHGQLSKTSDVVDLITNLPAGPGNVGLGTIKGGGKGLIAAAVEFLPLPAPFRFFDVKFVDPIARDPLASNAEIKNVQNIEFDDTSKTDLSDRNRTNVIKVVVEWQYPLVIPFADQIIYALTHTADLIAGYAQTGNAGAIAEIALGQYKRRPVWEVGWVLRSGAFTQSSLIGFRVPLRQSYVMRMQWDRGPGN